METQIMLRGLAVVLLSAAIHVHAQDANASREMPDWWKAERDVVAILMEQKTDIAKLVAKLSASKPKSGQEAMFRLSVFMRSGMNKEAIQTIRDLKGLCPSLDNHQVKGIYNGACGQFSAWEVAQSVVETFANNISGIALCGRLLEHFEMSGWSLERVDRWLAGMPRGVDSFWVKERLRFNVAHGQGEQLVRELRDGVRGNPEDIDGAVAFLEALIYARRTDADKWGLSWMTEAIRPKLATEAERIGSRLKRLGNWVTASTFYRQAIETPLTDDEVTQFGMMRQSFLPPEQLRAGFAAHTREGMAECLLKIGRSNEAQKWMVEAADIREKHKLGLNALFAGQVQGASGQRVIEERIKEEEKESENDPEYWWKRARYYRGRNEPEQEEQALRKGLGLTTPEPEPERRSKGHTDWRSWMLGDYAHFLARVNRTEEAVVLLRKEIEHAPATSGSAERAARLLALDFEKQVSVDDEVLWSWLANRPKWEHTEERLLLRMLENAKRDDLDKYFVRAEKSAKGEHPSRAHTLGWIMNRMRFPKRSIPLLEYAFEQTHDRELKERAVFTLFESYRDAGDWRRAEQMFPDASKRLTPREVSDWYSRIAVVAAVAGDKANAMRIWKTVANVNPAELADLGDLVKAGLRNELVRFYEEMRRKMPSSEIPGRALKALETK